jgi:transcriptional activator of glycolytic enzymes GCR1
MKSMAEVWQEWHYGFGENPSVVELDKRFGNRWCCNSKIRQRCSIRKRLVVAAKEASRRGVPVEDVISLIDKIKASDGHRLSRLPGQDFETALG